MGEGMEVESKGGSGVAIAQTFEEAASEERGLYQTGEETPARSALCAILNSIGGPPSRDIILLTRSNHTPW